MNFSQSEESDFEDVYYAKEGEDQQIIQMNEESDHEQAAQMQIDTTKAA